MSWLCKLLGHKLTRGFLNCKDGSVISVVKCRRCKFKRAVVLAPELVEQVRSHAKQIAEEFNWTS